MEKNTMTRREILTKVAPAAAVMGASMGALAQQAQPPPQQTGQVMKNMADQMFANGQYQLPPLPYEYDALEPHVTAEILRIHHDIHHQGYVNALNATVQKLDRLVRSGNYDQVNLAGLMRDLSYNGGGHMLHSLYWATMAPPKEGQNVPEGEIADAINQRYGSFDQFKTYFTQVAVTTKDSGWAVLIYAPFAESVGVFQVGDHDLSLVPGAPPLLTVDVWEHAYYLQYQNKRAAYVDAWWNLVNWPAVNEIYTFYRQQNRMAENMQT